MNLPQVSVPAWSRQGVAPSTPSPSPWLGARRLAAAMGPTSTCSRPPRPLALPRTAPRGPGLRQLPARLRSPPRRSPATAPPR
eukprot:6700818-Alexandrium_andersonii.AAC.1